MHSIRRIAVFYRDYAATHPLWFICYSLIMFSFIYNGIWLFVLVQLLAFTPAYTPTRSTSPVWPTVDVDTAPIGARCEVCGEVTVHMGAHHTHIHS